MTQSALARITGYAESHISGVETGQSAPSRMFLEACDDALHTCAALVTMWDLFRVVRFPLWFQQWLPFEERATFFRSFQLSVVDGLLQTPEYARALLYDDEAAVQARLDRQAILAREDPPPPKLHVVLDESVLHRQIGTPEVMRDQLLHLVGLQSQRLTIRVVPHGNHPGIQGSFVLASLDDGGDVAYEQAATRAHVLAGRDDLVRLADQWERITSQALPVGMSTELIQKVAEERWKT